MDGEWRPLSHGQAGLGRLNFMQGSRSCSSSIGSPSRFGTAYVEPLVSPAGLYVAVGHFGKAFLLFGSHLRLFPSTVGLHNGVRLRRGGGTVLMISARLQFQALQGQLLDAISQAAGAVLNLGPEAIAPERILTHSSFQCLEPKIKRGQSPFAVGHVVALEMV